MPLETQKFVRKRFEIEAVRVTPENMEEVARWCRGSITSSTNKVTGSVDDTYIRVKVLRADNDRQKRAYVGDWVLKAGSGFKSYRNEPFRRDFESNG